MKAANGPRQKHVPQRTCVACRQEDAKKALVRIVRTPAGEVRVDPSGKLSGRGAYLCSSRSCWELASRKRILEHALHTTLAPEVRAELDRFVESLPA